MLNETVHLNHDGGCFSINGGAVDVATYEKRIRLLKGEQMEQGSCPSAPTQRCEKKHDVEVCFSTPDGGEFSDIIELDSIHTEHEGRCYDASGPDHKIANLKKAAVAHGVKVEDGKCTDATMCIPKEWHDLTLCRSGKAGDWGNHESVHFDYAGSCMQFTGPAIKDAAIDKYISQKLAKEHKLREGTCKSAGFTERNYHKLVG